MARVLLIDDDPATRRVLKLLLERAGYEVTDVSDGELGVRSYRAEPADLVLTDILMPEKEGLELIRELKQDFPESKIVAMSGGGRTGNLDFLPLAERLGADRVLSKPIDRQELLQTLGDLLTDARPAD
jgi:CheY-like chemotaxis protein